MQKQYEIDYLNKKINEIELLQGIQSEFGYLPKDELVRVSKEFNVSLNTLYGIATFYAQFTFDKPAKYLIEVCTGTSCHINGADKIIEVIKNETNITDKASTDGKFYLSTARCLGCCGLAPVMAINGVIYGNLTTEKVKKILRELD